MSTFTFIDDNDTEDNLRQTLEEFKENLDVRHGLLRCNDAGEIIYGFIHGNWALNNSRHDGRWCGVNDEGPHFKRDRLLC